MQVERRAYYFPARKRGRLVESRSSPGCKKDEEKLKNGLWLAGSSSQSAERVYCGIQFFFPSEQRLNLKLGLWRLLRFLFLCFAELCFASSSLLVFLLPSSSGNLHGAVKGSSGMATEPGDFAASGACVRCSFPPKAECNNFLRLTFPTLAERWGETWEVEQKDTTFPPDHWHLFGVQPWLIFSGGSLALIIWCAWIPFQTCLRQLLRRNALLGRYWAQCLFQTGETTISLFELCCLFNFLAVNIFPQGKGSFFPAP